MAKPTIDQPNWGTTLNDHLDSLASDIDARETPAGAQAKADAAVSQVATDASNPATEVGAALSATFASKWRAATAYVAGDVRQAPDGSTIRRNTNGTSAAAFTTTELAAPVLSAPTTATTGGTIEAGTTYFYKATALNALGETIGSTEVSRAIAAALTTPVNAAFTTATTGGTLAAGTYSYRVSATNAAGETLASTATTQTVAAALAAPVLAAPTTATTGGTLAAATYYYKATAINAVGETIGSNEVSIATTGTTSTVGLSWAAITGATGYKIYRATVAGGESTSPALVATLDAVTTYTDTGTAVSAGAVPATNTTATTTNTVTVNWGAVAGATGYKVYGRTAAGELLMATLDAVTTWTDTGAVTPAGALPASNTTATNTNTVGLSWAAITGATGYKIYRATATGGQSTSPALVASVGAVTTYTDTGTAVTAGAVPATGTTSEKAHWTAVAAVAGTMEQVALSATIESLTATSNAKAEGAVGDGLADDTAVFVGLTGAVVVPPGTYRIVSTSTITADLIVAPGAKFTVAAGATLTIRGKIIQGATDMFEDSGGSIQFSGSENEYDLSWFKSGSGYINERWDFAKRAQATFNRKIIRIPAARAGVAGTQTLADRTYWGFNGPITLADAHNTSTWYVESEFYCVSDCAAFLRIDDAAKPEDIEFHGPIIVSIEAIRSVAVGIDIRAVARLTFWGEVVINGADTSISIGGPGQTAAVGSVRFFHAQCSFFSQQAVLIYGKAVHTTQDIQIDRLGATAAQLAGLPVLEVSGLVRDVKVGNVYYATDTPKNGYAAVDAEIVVLVQSNTQGETYKVEVGGIYQANANKGLVVRTDPATPVAADQIKAVRVGNIWGKSTGVGAELADCSDCHVGPIHNNADLTIASTCAGVSVETGAYVRTVTNNSTSSTVNGLGTQSRGAGMPPAPAVAWPIGALIRETTDNKVYLRVAKAGVAADFIALN